MALAAMRSVLLCLIGLGALFFLDAPLHTIGQTWTAQRPRQHNLLLAIGITLYALWALAKFGLHRDRRLAPAALEAPLALAGALVAAAGVVLAVWAKLRLGRWYSAAFGVKQGHVLVTDGPYAVTRHPIYTGILSTILGAALAWNSLLTLVLGALMAVPLTFHTVNEEALFERHFGDAYREYRRRVPRLAPVPRRTR